MSLVLHQEKSNREGTLLSSNNKKSTDVEQVKNAKLKTSNIILRNYYRRLGKKKIQELKPTTDEGKKDISKAFSLLPSQIIIVKSFPKLDIKF